jgi:hypothetical protein
MVAVALTAIAFTGAAPAVASEPGRQPSAPWTAPLQGPLLVERGFDPPEQPWLPGHRGVDLLAATGDSVLAAGSGQVVFSGLVAGRGVVSVEHPATATAGQQPLRTTYEPVAGLLPVGSAVKTGEVIGRLESVGAHCAPTCLHWGLRRGESYLDPLQLLRPPRARLLPHLPSNVDGRPPSVAPGRASTAARGLEAEKTRATNTSRTGPTDELAVEVSTTSTDQVRERPTATVVGRATGAAAVVSAVGLLAVGVARRSPMLERRRP